MNIKISIIILAVASTWGLMTRYAFGTEVTAEQRSSARLYARVETSLASRDQKAYCDAFHGTEDYRGYLGRACEFGIKVGVRKPEECTTQALAARAEADYKKCLVMNNSEFDATIVKHREARAGFVRTMAEKGIDGDKLIAEEHTKVK